MFARRLSGNLVLTHLISVTLRPFETKDDDKYTFICMGRELDAAKMASGREEFIKVFYETSGRTDIEFGDLIWISNFQ